MASTDSEYDLGKARTLPNGNVVILPDHPGPHPKTHLSSQWLEIATSRLGGEQLLEVADGNPPPKNHTIRDFDLSMLPVLPPSDPHHDKRMEVRMRYQRENEANAAKRKYLWLSELTRLFNSLAACCEKSHPALFRDLQDLCKMEDRMPPIHGGYRDGGYAWRLVLASLTPAERSKADIDYYELADKLQLEHPLQANASSDEFSMKARQFAEKIQRNLARPYPPELAGKRIVEMLPANVEYEKSRLIDKFTAEGTITDLRYVINQCTDVVYRATKGKPAEPTVVTVSAEMPFDITDLALTCGMNLALPQAPAGGGAYLADQQWAGKKTSEDCPWCEDGPHYDFKKNKKQCVCDPDYQGTCPPSRWVSPEKHAATEALRKYNCAKAGKTYKPLTAPSDEAIEKFKARQARRNEKRGGGDDAKAANA